MPGAPVRGTGLGLLLFGLLWLRRQIRRP
jgi:MYXO-CTERM domain-containing protein